MQTELDNTSFEYALLQLKQGRQARRSSWKDLVPPVLLKTSKPSKLYPIAKQTFYQAKANKDGTQDLIPWLPNLDDLTANDWRVV